MYLLHPKTGTLLNNQWVASSEMQEPPLILEECRLQEEEGKLFLKSKNQWISVRPITTDLLMYDPDAPFPQHPTRSPILHWWNLQGQTIVPYMGPHPPPTSDPHRYIILHFANANGTTIDLRPLKFFESHRSNFPMRLISDLGLRVLHTATFFCSK